MEEIAKEYMIIMLNRMEFRKEEAMSSRNFHQEVRIVPYQENWYLRFCNEKERISALLSANGIYCDIRHVGGTAIPGMPSKPIVDILVLVEERFLLTARDLLASQFNCLGECGRPGRYFFSTGETERDAAYIHLTTPEHRVAKDQIRFYEMLLASEELRMEYANIKLRLAEEYPKDRTAYRLEKGVFIQNCLREKGVFEEC